MIDASALQIVLAVLTGWLDQQERQAVAYLMEENRILRRLHRGQRLQFTDHDRRGWRSVGIGWVLGSTPHPGDLFMGQIVRFVTAADDGVLIGHRVLICDRDRK